jgi:hypothetical protein
MTMLEHVKATTLRGRRLALVLSVVLCAPGLAAASDFDGSHTLLCAPTDAVQCEGAGECERKEVEVLNMAKFLTVDFKKKRLRGTVEGASEEETSPIQTVQSLEGVTLAQGADNVRGWSLGGRRPRLRAVRNLPEALMRTRSRDGS